jgi:hypothetical protein
MYSSRWKNESSAQSFFEVFEQELPRQYDGLKRRKSDEMDENERVYTTKEGDVYLKVEGKNVWVSEGFDLVMARKLRAMVDDAQGHGPVLSAKNSEIRVRQSGPVTGLSGWLGGFGMMRVALR